MSTEVQGKQLPLECSTGVWCLVSDRRHREGVRTAFDGVESTGDVNTSLIASSTIQGTNLGACL